MYKKQTAVIMVFALAVTSLLFFFSPFQEHKEASAEETSRTGIVSGVESSLNVRSGANASSEIRGGLPNGSTIEIEDIVGNWALIYFNDTYGYVSMNYVDLNKPSAGSSGRTGEYQGTVTGVNTSLNVRSGANASSEIRGSLPNGTTVEVESTVGNWALIYFNDTYGYVSLSYLSVVEGSSPSPVAGSPLTGETIAIDPGHGGSDPGAVGNGLQEKDVVLDIGRRVEQKLNAAGSNVVMTRSNDVYVGLERRAQIANSANADSFVSIHANAFNGAASGSETFYYSGSRDGAELAGLIQEEMVKALGTADRGSRDGNFSVIRNTSMPAVLAETAFIDEPSDAAKLRSSAFREAAASAIVRGLERYYN
ncbi:N-acetylmuramoyl-L-alanine amidase [Sinobaca qinghaiensis]|uniref:N-acetylmuramoyl-L-alanine amidase n=1 Tax=Sinobaca qinghaiensis TaxID=342944 RepID=A0A419V5K2_9BACL|nr:N-acetylmuramoyl-L-alanine amidase [Sinobaca qinghaiensis]RKD75265.1 N-acetylmuramoyl-L-alanine amidase [Sinobaca qinghaiensis]